MKKAPLPLKIIAAVILAPFILGAGLTVILKIYLSPAKIRALAVDAAQKQLHREVRINDVSLNFIHGLTLHGLEVSEKPAFSAGTFLGMEAFQLNVQWAPLLHKRVIVDRVSAKGLWVGVVAGKSGKFNFSDLLSPAPAKAQAESAPAKGLPFELDVKHASLSGGRLSYRDRTSGGAWQVSDMEAKLSNLSLAKPFGAEVSLRAEQEGPGGIKASLSFSGEVDLSKQASGKIDVSIEKAKANLSGIDIEAAGAIALDNDRISIPELKGKLREGKLKLSLVAEHISKAPDIEVKIDLDRLDLSALAAARQASGNAPAPAAAAASAPKNPPAASGIPISAHGQVNIGKLLYSSIEADNMNISWNLFGITPDLRRLGGWAKLNVSGGTFNDEGKPASHSALIKALLIPLTILKEIGALGEKLRLLPDFKHIVFTEIVGDYAFERGLMTLKDFHMKSAAANIRTLGTIDIPAQKLNLKVNAMVARLAPLDITVGGTFDRPEPRFRLDKTLFEPAKKLITEPALNLLKNIFKK